MHYLLRSIQILSDFSGFLIVLVILFVLVLFVSYKTFKSSRSETVKKLIVVCCFSIFILYFFFCIGEAYFRYVYDESDALGFLLTNQHWLAKHVVYNNAFYRDDTSYTFTKPKGVTRIGVIGESFTFGWGIKNVNDRFSNILQQKLRAAGKNVQVYNFGVPGDDTCSELPEFAKNLKLYQVDIYVWEYYLNNIQPCGSTLGGSTGTRFITQIGDVNPVMQWLINRSYFINFVYWKLKSSHENALIQLRNDDINQWTNPPVVSLEEANMSSLSADLKGPGGTRPVVAVIFPQLLDLQHYPDSSIHKLLHNEFTKLGDSYVDLLPELRGDPSSEVMVNQFDNHPNEYVNRIAANELYKKILPMLK